MRVCYRSTKIIYIAYTARLTSNCVKLSTFTQAYILLYSNIDVDIAASSAILHHCPCVGAPYAPTRETKENKTMLVLL